MKLYTSYYARDAKHPNAVSISASAPNYFTGRRMPELAPSWDLLNAYKEGKISADEYTVWYFQLLEHRKLDPHKVVEALGDGAVIMCYEVPGAFCHRKLVAKWISDLTGIEVVELASLPTKHDKIVDELLTF